MKKRALIAAVIYGALLASVPIFPATGAAEVQINIGLPPLILSAPPVLVVIPGTYVYYPPDVGVEIFFYRGYWYRPYAGAWFIASGYNGPWRRAAIERVPPSLLRVPPSYRQGPPGYRPMPYGQVKKNWRTWERERYWDRHEDRGEHRGRGHGRDRDD